MVTPLLWFASLLFALTSVGSATNQAIVLHRISVYPDGLARIQMLLSNGSTNQNAHLSVDTLQMWIWQTPAAFLNGSLYLFIAGLLALIVEISKSGPPDTSTGSNMVRGSLTS